MGVMARGISRVIFDIQQYVLDVSHSPLAFNVLSVLACIVVFSMRSDTMASQLRQLNHTKTTVTTTSSNAVPTELLVKFKQTYRSKVHNSQANATGLSSVDQRLQRHHVTGFERVAKESKKAKTNTEFFGWYKVSLDPNRPIAVTIKDGQTYYPDLDALKSDLSQDPSVETTSYNYISKATVIPDDPYYSSSGAWGQGFADLWGLKKINAASAWDQTTGSSGVIVAVIDSGVDITHPDIAANIWTNPGEIPGNNIDDDGNGYIDDVHGWNFNSGTSNPVDDNGHGTHVAGTIAGVGNNGTGIVGVSWNTTIMPLKFLNSSGSGSNINAAQAMQYAADNGAKISSNSYGCACTNDQFLIDAIKYEHDRNVTMIAAAGNNSTDALTFAPGSEDGAIAVAATDSTDGIAAFSNTGIRIDVSAPGVEILSLKSSNASAVCTGAAIVNTNYCHISGTSMATPHVSGLAALMLAKNPSLTPEQIRQILRTTSVDIGTAGRDNTFGYGRIDANAAVAASMSPTVLTPIITSPTTRTTVSRSVTMTGSADGVNFVSYKVEASQGRTGTGWVTLATSNTPVTNGTLATFDSSILPDGMYVFRLTATSSQGKTYEYSMYDVTVNNFAVAIHEPFNLVPIGAGNTIRGVANVNTGLTFGHYTIDWGVGTSPSSWSTAGVTLANGGNVAVPNSGSLATWDTSALADGSSYTLRLTVYATNGSYSSATQTIAPDAKLVAGWPKYIAGTNCTTFCNGAGEAFADIDGDGQQEVVIPAATNVVYAYHKNGTLVSGWPVTVTTGDYFKTQPVIADIDGDLKPEIILNATIGSTQNKRLYIIKADGTLYPGWSPVTITASGVGDDPTPSVADLNNDGSKELVLISPVTAFTSQLHAYKPNGTELSGFPKNLSFAPWIMMPPTIADLDHDGYPEIIYPRYNQVYVFNHDGNVRSGWPVTLTNYGGNVQTGQGPASVGDVNGDGTKEIIATGMVNGVLPGAITVYAYAPNGQLLSGWPYQGTTQSYTVGVALNTTALVDIDHDGKDTVITGNWGASIIDDGTGKRSLPYNALNASPSIADFAGDGALKFPGIYNHGIQWIKTDFTSYWVNNNLFNLASENPSFSTIVVSDIDHNNKQEFAASVKHTNELYAYLWEMPGSTKPKDNWPVFGHDAQHTGNYIAGQVVTDATAPQVVMDSPTAGASVSGTVTLKATAIDDSGTVGSVTFYDGATPLGTSTSFPFQITWDTTAITPGSHSLTARATDPTGNATTSAAVLVTVLDVTPPSNPSNLQTSAITDGSLALAWDASSDNVSVSGYRVYRDGVLLGTTTQTQYVVPGLVPATQYTVAVEAFDAAGNVSSRPSTQATTLADQTAPTVPQNLSATNITDISLRLNWDASTDNTAVTGYQVYRDGILVGTSAVTYFDDTGLMPLTQYAYTVKAYDALNNTSSFSGAYSPTTLSDTTVPTAATGLQVANVTMYAMRLQWSAASDDVGVTGYDIYRNGTLLGSTAQLQFDVSGLRPGTAYAYLVVAYDAAGNHSGNASISANTVADAVLPTLFITAPAANATLKGSATITATASDNDILSSVKVYVDTTLLTTISGGTVSYNWNSSSTTDGTHTIKLVATDASGNTTTKTVSVTVSNHRRGDVNGDNKVNVFDLSGMLSKWNTSDANADLDHNGRVNIFDLSILLYEYGK